MTTTAPETQTLDIIPSPQSEGYVPLETRIQRSLQSHGITRVAAHYKRDTHGHEINGMGLFAGNKEVPQIPDETYDGLDMFLQFRLDRLSHLGIMHLDVATMQLRDEVLHSGKDIMLDLLKTWGVATVTAHYDGCGDNGCVETIDADIPLTPKQTEQLEDFAWDCVVSKFSGFENNDGGFGNVEIDVEARTIKLQHNTNVVETLYEETNL